MCIAWDDYPLASHTHQANRTPTHDSIMFTSTTSDLMQARAPALAPTARIPPSFHVGRPMMITITSPFPPAWLLRSIPNMRRWRLSVAFPVIPLRFGLPWAHMTRLSLITTPLSRARSPRLRCFNPLSRRISAVVAPAESLLLSR